MQHLFEELVAEVQRTSPATAATLRSGLPPALVKEKMAYDGHVDWRYR